MTTSTNENTETGAENPGLSGLRGAFADGLTFIRALMTPIIMLVIILAWTSSGKAGAGGEPVPASLMPVNLSLILLAAILFAVAAISDVIDDFIGGKANSKYRIFGWLDDIADSVLIAGTLSALLWVTHKAGLLHWTFAVPAIALIARDVVVALTKGYELSKSGFAETRLGDFKSGLAMLAALLLVSAPWLTNIIHRMRAGAENADLMQVYSHPSSLPWNAGLICLWAAALLAVYTGYKIIISKPRAQA